MLRNLLDHPIFLAYLCALPTLIAIILLMIGGGKHDRHS
jgi:hypothetical protein